MIKTFEEAEKFIYKYIDTDPKKRFSGEFGLHRAAYLLRLAGDPQNKLKMIHVAGTSGKGSTAFYISQLLRSQGFKVALTISPHLVDLRERCQINNELISKAEFVKALNKTMLFISEMEKTKFGSPSYFEILMTMFFLVVNKNKVDYAVVETGLGGTYDGTNVVNRADKVCVITKIGYDHTEILGDRLNQIAVHKAGIIQKGNQLLTLNQEIVVNKILKERVGRKKGATFFVEKNTNYKNTRLSHNKIIFDFAYKNISVKDIILNTFAFYQVENSSLALTALFYLSQRDKFTLNIQKVKKILRKVYFKGRMENFLINGKTIIIDGAHNPQKMKSFIASLKNTFNGKFAFLIAFRAGKNFSGMIDLILPYADKIVLTGFKTTNMDLQHHSEDANLIAEYLKKNDFNNYEIINDSKKALINFLKNKSEHLVITGSLYLLSAIYKDLIYYS